MTVSGCKTTGASGKILHCIAKPAHWKFVSVFNATCFTRGREFCMISKKNCAPSTSQVAWCVSQQLHVLRHKAAGRKKITEAWHAVRGIEFFLFPTKKRHDGISFILLFGFHEKILCVQQKIEYPANHISWKLSKSFKKIVCIQQCSLQQHCLLKWAFSIGVFYCVLLAVTAKWLREVSFEGLSHATSTLRRNEKKWRKILGLFCILKFYRRQKQASAVKFNLD